MTHLHPSAETPATEHSLFATLRTAASTAVGLDGGEDTHARPDLYSYIGERGFHLPPELVTRYLLALRSKPLVLFSGISGTGKTRLALLTAEYYAQHGGQPAARRARPVDGDHDFYVPIDAVTLRSGTLTPSRDQLDYFAVPSDGSSSFTGSVMNVLGAHGDTTFRTTTVIHAGRRHLSVQVPSNVRRSLHENGVTDRDYLHFRVVEEHRRFEIALYRPDVTYIDVPPEDRFSFVSVRPSWNDHTAMVGHFNAEQDRYERTPVLELLLRAAREERDAAAAGVAPAPYFVVLDEMNIARIEQYFSDFLSALESRRSEADGSIRQESIHLHSADARRHVWIDRHGIEYDIPERLEVPTNVVFTGTVNLDGSTFPLSPKVVDRASVISFNAVDFAGFLSGDSQPFDGSPLQLTADGTCRLELGARRIASAADSRAVADALSPFVELNRLLAVHDQHVGYRVLNDVALYVGEAMRLVGDDRAVVMAAVDTAIVQKIMARFESVTHDRYGMLGSLLEFCIDGRVHEQRREQTVVEQRESLLASVRLDGDDMAHHMGGDGATVAFPRAAGRLVRMLGTMRE